jgi:hypothetical protein
MSRIVAIAAVLLALAGCATAPAPQKETLPMTPPQDIVASSIVRTPLAPTPVPAPAPDADKAAALPFGPVVVPPNTLYVCVIDTQGVRQQTAIEFSPKVGALCRRHPEMSACQYERNICRRSGGRVFVADGTEITQLTELEYDKRVLRVIFRADEGAATKLPARRQKRGE